MADGWRIYLRWPRDRRRSTIWWTVGIVLVSVATAAFYPSLENASGEAFADSGTMPSILGLSEGIDPSTPLGFLWSMNYSNQLPWLLMALGIALGTAAIAGTTITNPGVTVGDLATGGFAAFAVALGSGSVSYFVGAARGRKGEAMGVGGGLAIAG